MLKSKKSIDLLFEKGRTVKKYPFIIKFAAEKSPEDHEVKFLFSVSKRALKKAVERNRMKRIMREIIRMNKSALYSWAEKNQVSLHFAILYAGKKLLTYQESEKKIILILEDFKTLSIQELL